MSRLLRARAWPILALFAGVTSVWAGDLLWLRPACAAGLVIGIAQQLVLLARSIRMGMLGTFWVRLTAATMPRWSCLLVSGELPRCVPVVAGLLVVLGGLWWFCIAVKDSSTSCSYKSAICRELLKSLLTLHAGHGWAGVVICGFLVLGLSLPPLSLPAAVFTAWLALRCNVGRDWRAVCALHRVQPGGAGQASLTVRY